MNIEQLTEYLHSIKGKEGIIEGIPVNATLLSLRIGNGWVNFSYNTDNQFTNVNIPCKEAKNKQYVKQLIEEGHTDAKIHIKEWRPRLASSDKLFRKKGKRHES